MIARNLIREFCQEYELERPPDEGDKLDLEFEEGFVVGCLPSQDDSYVRLVCRMETPVADDPAAMRRVLEYQTVLTRDYQCAAALTPAGGPLFLTAVVECSGADVARLSQAIQYLVDAARSLLPVLTLDAPGPSLHTAPESTAPSAEAFHALRKA